MQTIAMKQPSLIISTTNTDAAIIERVQAGEKQLFEILIRKYNQRLYRIGMSILAHPADTQDAMQTSYINAYQNLSRFENRSEFATWLSRIMFNQCQEQQCKSGHIQSGIDFNHNYTTMKTPEKDLANKDLGFILEREITALPEQYRLVFVLREIEDMTVRETAEMLAIEEINVKVRLNRAKALLRQRLQGYMKNHVYSIHLSRCNRIVSYVMQQLGISNNGR
ncbi:sigma-70 family RNA polymerase sigma factor [Chitinophaga sp. Hz27]|uniref:sigma-70 family RNA polymerase sigma factor n=1 Tax=Chitinophaga sp. Hz27 TaxID=3347169 RepID=UPI0035DD43F6